MPNGQHGSMLCACSARDPDRPAAGHFAAYQSPAVVLLLAAVDADPARGDYPSTPKWTRRCPSLRKPAC